LDLGRIELLTPAPLPARGTEAEGAERPPLAPRYISSEGSPRGERAGVRGDPLTRFTFKSNEKVVRIQSHGTLRDTARGTEAEGAERPPLAPRYISLKLLRVGRGPG
jgi:hypothetical protein